MEITQKILSTITGLLLALQTMLPLPAAQLSVATPYNASEPEVLGASTGGGDFVSQIINTTNTQAVLVYTAPDTNSCKVQVSENSSLSPLVHDVNPSLFANADSDNKAESLYSDNKRIFVIGKRLVEKGIDGNNYSRALQTNTTHYFKITCGNQISSGSFITANIPFGMTYSDGIQNDPNNRSGYIYPTVSGTDRDSSFIDPRTGVFFKPLALKPDGALANSYKSFSWSSAGFHEWCSPKVSANGFFHCAIPNDWTWMLYGIHQTTGEVRYLGSMHFVGQIYDVTEGFRACNVLAGIPWDMNDPNVFYCPEYQDTTRELVVLKITYTGNDQPVTQGLVGGVPTQAPKTVVNLTPPPNTLLKQLKDFDPDFDSSKYNCGLDGGNMAGYLSITCRRGEQDTFAWIGAFDVKNQKVAAFTKMWEQPKLRWCTHHSYEFVGNSPVFSVATQMAKGAMFQVTLTNSLPGSVPGGSLSTANVTSAWDRSWGNQPAGWQTGDPVSPNGKDKYLMDLKVGDHLYASDNIEFMEVVEIKSPTEIVLKRGLGNDQSYYKPKPHSAGNILMPYCNSNPGNPHDLPYVFWRFLDAPKGGDPAYFGTNFGSHPVHRGPYRASEGAFKVAYPDDMSKWGLGRDGAINVSPKFAGAFMPAEGNYFEKHASMPSVGAPWFLDMHPYTGGEHATVQNNSATKSLGGSLYQYYYGGLDIPHYGGDGLNRKQAATFAFNGNYQMVDISGPSAVIGIGSEYNYTYCIANKAGECVSGSSKGDIYFNVPSLTYKYCDGKLFFDGNLNVCIGDMPTIGFGITQNRFLSDSTGQAIRILSKAFAYAHQPGTANVKVTPDGSWGIVNSYTGGHILLMKIPPIPASDGIDRTTFIRTPLNLVPPSGKGITQAKVYFGYSEQGNPTDYYCTSRREACVSSASSIVDSNPFSYAVSDSYSNMPCTTSCTITLPVLPMRTAYFKVSYLDASGIEVATENGVAIEKHVTSLGGASNNLPPPPPPANEPPTPTPTPPAPPPADTTPPIISNVEVVDITETGATVTWVTDEPSSSQVEYGLTSSYGSISAVDSTPVTNHIMVFSNLAPHTKYNFRVISEDWEGNSRTSSKYIFTTKPKVADQANPDTGSDNAVRTDWSNKKTLTINGSQISGSLSDFPVLVSFTDPDLRFTSNGGKVGKSDGSDILFVDSNDQKLSHEIEKYDPATGELVAWVKLPTLSSSVDTAITLYFGNPSSSLEEDRANVWDSNFKAVFHLNSNANDATSNSNDGTIAGSPGSVAGQIGDAYSFDGSTNYITSGTNGFSSGSQSATLEAWVDVDGQGSYHNGTFLFGYGSRSYMKQASVEAKWNSKLWSLMYGDSRNFSADFSKWSHLSYVISPRNSYTLYVDGDQVSSGNINNYGDPWAVDLSSGFGIAGLGSASSKAKIDEVRVSNVARSAEWIKTAYNNQSSPTSFVNIGASQTNTKKQTQPETANDDNGQRGNPTVTPKNVAQGNHTPQTSRSGSYSGRSVINSSIASSSGTSSSVGVINRNLYRGAEGNDVRALQQFLVSQGLTTPDNVTGYYGPITESAIKAFQRANNIISYGDPISTGYGFVGPSTRARINQIMASGQTYNASFSNITPAQIEIIKSQILALQRQVLVLLTQLQTLLR